MKKLRLWLLILPFALFYLGAALNLLVIAANHGTMPCVIPYGWIPTHLPWIIPGFQMDVVHRVINPHDIHLAFLCDWIFVPFMESVVSPGDCLLWLGDWLTVPLVSAWFALLIFGSKEAK
jgi:Family of unknown function (DUF5317)